MSGDVEVTNRRFALKIMFIAVGMFFFAVGIMPPMYDVICDITGLNGKTSSQAAVASEGGSKSDRVVTVQFLADTGDLMPWEFRPEKFSVQVHIGEVVKVDYFAKNLSDNLVVGQAIPSVSPGEASAYFKKTQCFCFDKQPLLGRESKDMPVVFYVDPALPEHVNTITLSYTLYNITNRVADNNGR